MAVLIMFGGKGRALLTADSKKKKMGIVPGELARGWKKQPELHAAPELGATTETLALIPSGAGGLRLSYSNDPRWPFLPLAARSLVFGPKYDSLSRD